MTYNTCTCTNVLRHVRDLFKLIPNAFNVRQRVTSPLFHTSYYLKDWIEQVAYLGIYYNNTLRMSQHNGTMPLYINMVLHGNVIYPYISLHVNTITFTRDPSQRHIGILVLFLHYLVLLADSLYTVIF